MTQTKSLLYGLIIAAILAGVYLLGASALRVGASAPSGLPATVAVATTTVVGPQVNVQIFSASSCSSRIVSTVGGSAIMIAFADPTNGNISSTTLSGGVGHWQAASTTVAYDSGLYGCGRAFAYGYASTTIMLTETR